MQIEMTTEILNLYPGFCVLGRRRTTDAESGYGKGRRDEQSIVSGHEICGAIAPESQGLQRNGAPDLCGFHWGKRGAFRDRGRSGFAATAGAGSQLHPADVERLSQSRVCRRQ